MVAENGKRNDPHLHLHFFTPESYICVNTVLDNESTYVAVGIAFDPHVAAVFTSQMTEIHGQGPSMTKANNLERQIEHSILLVLLAPTGTISGIVAASLILANKRFIPPQIEHSVSQIR